MKLVIDIPEEIYHRYKKVWQKRRGSIPESCIAFGIPLPKGHGRLKDVDHYNKMQLEHPDYSLMDDEPTIIEADKVESDSERKPSPWWKCERCGKLIPYIYLS